MNRITLSIFISVMVAFVAQGQSDTMQVKQLNEVVVLAKNKLIKVEGSITTINISGTPFSNIGSLSDMLPNLPGIVKKGNGIEVSGSGRPLFVLDGRELQDESELNAINSDNIKNIKIEKSPGPQYSADVKAVVYISTKKHLNDYLFFQVANTLGLRRKVHETPSLNLRGKIGKLTTTLSYVFGHSNFLNKETYFRSIYNNDQLTESFFLNQPRDFNNVDNAHTINWMGEYQINSFNRIGLYYYGRFSSPKSIERGKSESEIGGEILSTPFSEYIKSSVNLNSVTALYNYNKGSSSLLMSQDIAFRYGESKRNTIETNNNNDISSDNLLNYRIYTTNIRYDRQLPYKIGLSCGLRYSYVYSKSDLSSVGKTSYEVPARNTSVIKEHNPQIYLALARKIGNFYISPGLRYEYASRYISNSMTNENTKNIKQHYSNLYPWIIIKYENNHGVSLYGKYVRKCTHPSFSQLNSGLVYHDAYSYSDGNLNLKTSFTNDYRLGGSFRDLEFELNYFDTRNQIEQIESLMSSAPAIVRQYSINIPKYNEWSFSVGYYLSLHKFNIYANVRSIFPNVTIPINDNMINRNQISFDGELNITYQPNDWLSMYSNLNHQGHREYITMTQKSVQLWNFGINANVINNRLKLSLEVMDILNRGHYNNMTCYYKNISWGTHGTIDGRGIRFRISYTFFNKPIKSFTKRGNEDIIHRTE